MAAAPPTSSYHRPCTAPAVRKRIEKKSMSNILIRLRQTCNHPYLLPGQEPEVGGEGGRGGWETAVS